MFGKREVKHTMHFDQDPLAHSGGNAVTRYAEIGAHVRARDFAQSQHLFFRHVY